MSVERAIRELIQLTLSDDHRPDCLRCVDEFLRVAADVHKIHCCFAGEGKLRFQVPEEPAWEVELGRAKSKLRMMCARLSVLCNETGGSDVTVFGGLGIIRKEVPVGVNNSLDNSRSRAVSHPSAQRPQLVTWEVCFQNTPAQQEFTICLQ